MNVLEIIDLYKTYRSPFLLKKIKALKGVSFSVKEGEVFGLLGPNGAGKTTIFKSILGFVKSDSGKIKIFGKDLKRELFEKIGFLPENPYFYSHLTGYETLQFYSSFFKKRLSKTKITDLLEKIGLKDAINRRVNTYSKGMIQRIGFAQAIINNPDLIILDEPMSGLDPLWRKEMKDWIEQLKKDGKTIIFSTHILSDVEEICDTVGILNKGKIIKIGRLSEILSYENVSFEAVISGLNNKELKNFGEVIKHDKYQIVKIKSNVNLESLLRFVLKNKGKIISVEPKRKKLEDYFMEVLKNED